MLTVMNKIIDTIKQNYILLIVVLLAGILTGRVISGRPGDASSSITEPDEHPGHDHVSEDPSTWTCSMHPQIKQDSPGDCPICGMDLVPLSTLVIGTDVLADDEIMLSEAAIGIAEIQTSIIGRGRPGKEIYLQGRVVPDETRMTMVTARFAGRIEKLHVNFTGEKVIKGEKLATVYSPELVTAQKELLEAIEIKDSHPTIYRAARSKLKLWDLSEEQISMIEDGTEPIIYFDVLAAQAGTVMERYVASGDYIGEGEPLFMLNDLDHLWVVFDAYEEDLPWIRTGDRMDFSIRSVPGVKLSGKVSFIDPFINGKTRTAGLRVEVDNTVDRIKPGMFAGGKIISSASLYHGSLLIPKSSVLWTGERSIVYVRQPDRVNPVFSYREIELGPDAGDYYVVEDGIEEGEIVATNGVFKIDAAAQLEGKKSMMNPEGGKVSPDHDHGSMDMVDTKTETNHEQLTEMSGNRAPAAFKKQMTGVYDAYIYMKDAFVSSDASAVSKKAEQVLESLGKVDMDLLRGDAHTEWIDQLGVLENTLRCINAMKDIAEQRKSFLAMNNTLYKTVKEFGIDRDTVYYQYCPMAHNDRGGYWLSNEKEIRNPYFGNMMLKCGEVRDTIIRNSGDF